MSVIDTELKAPVSDLVSSALLRMVSSKISTPAIAVAPMAESDEKRSIAELLQVVRKGQSDGSIVVPVPIDVLEPCVDPTCDVASLTSAFELHDRYKAGEDVGELDKVTQFVFDSTHGQAMINSIKVGHAVLSVLAKATGLVEQMEALVNNYPDREDADFWEQGATLLTCGWWTLSSSPSRTMSRSCSLSTVTC